MTMIMKDFIGEEIDPIAVNKEEGNICCPRFPYIERISPNLDMHLHPCT